MAACAAVVIWFLMCKSEIGVFMVLFKCTDALYIFSKKLPVISKSWHHISVMLLCWQLQPSRTSGIVPISGRRCLGTTSPLSLIKLHCLPVQYRSILNCSWSPTNHSMDWRPHTLMTSSPCQNLTIHTHIQVHTKDTPLQTGLTGCCARTSNGHYA